MVPKTYKKIIYTGAHISLFIVFFWFGAIKLFGVSPANELVAALQVITLPWWPFESFIIFLGLWEMLIGTLMLFKKTERVGILLLIPHMFTTFLPLFMLPAISWQSLLVPTLEGQYIIKNLIIVALATSIVFAERRKRWW
jgi:uncharacterized membrane protein YkgB